jgi:hypothetical protein
MSNIFFLGQEMFFLQKLIWILGMSYVLNSKFGQFSNLVRYKILDISN